MNNLSLEHKIELWHNKGETYCSVCYEPVYGNVNPNAILTCGKCVQRGLKRYESKIQSIPENIKTGGDLRRFREALKSTQEQMAKKLRLSISHYKKLEGNERKITLKMTQIIQRRATIIFPE